MKPEVRIESLLDVKEAPDAAAFARYAEPERLAHYARLHDDMLARYGDLALAQAAFLHGLPSTLIQHAKRRGTDPDVVRILKGYENFLALDGSAPDATQYFLQQFLPQVADFRSVLLVIHEHLAHTDPKGAFQRWCRDFVSQPRALDIQLPTNPFAGGRRPHNDPLRFSSNVLAPAAKAIGLFDLRGVMEDLPLVVERRAEAEELVGLFLADATQAYAQGTVDRVREALSPEASAQVTWANRHLTKSLANLGRGYTTTASLRNTLKTGYVEIGCHDVAACYRALGELHARFRYKPAEIRDFFGQPTESGYRALHTALLLDGAVANQELMLKVRISDLRYEDERRRRSGPELLTALQQNLRAEQAAGLYVFSPEGLRVDLPLGSSVLNYARAIHADLLSHVKEATVNREPVGLLYPLKVGDVVWLHRTDEAQPLPQGWENGVAPGTERSIRKNFRKGFRIILREAGREMIVREIAEREVELPTGHDSGVDILLEAVLRDPEAKSRLQFRIDADWWLEQLGLLSFEQRGQAQPFPLNITRDDASHLIDLVAERAGRSKKLIRDELDLPDTLARQARQIELCPRCGPPLSGSVLASVADGIMTLHRHGANCVAAGSVVTWRRRMVSDRYYVMETTNRIGVAEEILAVFRKRRIDVADLVGQRHLTNSGVLRVKVDYLRQSEARRVQEELAQIAGVTCVYGPYDAVSSRLEGALPPRRTADQTIRSEPQPYCRSEPVLEEHFFYGMSEQLQELEQQEAEAFDWGRSAGKSVFVHGPLRSGKTSLVRRFLDGKKHQGRSAPVAVWFEAPRHKCWLHAENKLVRKLYEAAEEVAQLDQVKYGKRCNRLEDEVRKIIASLGRPVILVVDEAVEMYTSSQKNEPSVTNLLRFLSFVESTPGLLVVWIGPTAPVRNLDARLLNKLLHQYGLPVGRLGVIDTRDLLAVAKQKPRHDIVVPQHLANRVQELTYGNPFWTAEIGYEMWRGSKMFKGADPDLRAHGRLLYHEKLLEAAVQALVQNGTIFSDRCESRRSYNPWRNLTWAVLTVLAAPDKESDSSDTGRTRLEITRELGKYGHRQGPDAVDEHLQIMADQGSIKLAEQGRWRIAAPLLARFVTTRNL